MTNYWFISSPKQKRSTLALITFLLAFVVILLGAYTRLTDAGLSCPDWPHCFGYLTAPTTVQQLQIAAQKFPATPVDIKKAWTEMTHRYFAGMEGILILLLVGSILVRKSLVKNSQAKLVALLLIGLLGVQVMLGMFTVTAKLKPVIVLAHLLTGLSILSLLWWSYLNLYNDHAAIRRHSPVKPWFWVAFIVVTIQISLGGFVSSHYAGLVCIDLPYCNGVLIPTMQWSFDDLITIHMLHRIGAILTALYMGLLCTVLLMHRSFRLLAACLLALVILQLSLGILNIIWLRPVWIALAHHTVAILLLLTIITGLVKASDARVSRYA